jgi:peptidoglycan/LPS O-acetylase OafA/YrhL
LSNASTSSIAHNKPRYEYLDALRGLAIFGVMVTHCAFVTQSTFHKIFLGIRYPLAGSYGVQLFFMISAFTIFMTLARSSSRDTHLAANFYIRRFFRILPMFWVGILLYTFVPGREKYPPPFDLTFIHYFLTATLQHGWHPNSLNSVVPGGWSIAVEATFYLVAPLLFALIKGWRSAFLFFLITLVSYFACMGCLNLMVDRGLLFPNVQPYLMYYFKLRWFPSQLPVFAMGILVFHLWQSLPPLFFRPAIGIGLLIASAAYIFLILSAGGVALVPEHQLISLGFGLLFLGLAIHPIPPLVNSFTCLLGRISYSFYLLHFVMLEIAIYAIQYIHPINNGLAIFALLSMLTLILSTAVSYLSFKFVETPFIAIGSNIIKWIERPVPKEQPQELVIPSLAN